MTLSGQNANGGYDYTITFGNNSRRAKRDGRNPSTGAFTSGQTTGIVDDSIEFDSGVGIIHQNIDSYKSANEIEASELS